MTRLARVAASTIPAVVIGSVAARAAADTPIDVIAGTPGAAWTVTGLFALVLGAVLGKYLPELMRQLALKDTQLLAAIEAKDAQIAEIVAKQEKAVDAVVDQFTVAIERQRTQFRETLEMVQAHHAREVQGLGDATNKSMDSIAAAVRALETAISKKGV